MGTLWNENEQIHNIAIFNVLILSKMPKISKQLATITPTKYGYNWNVYFLFLAGYQSTSVVTLSAQWFDLIQVNFHGNWHLQRHICNHGL